MTVLPFLANESSNFTIWKALKLSSPEVGSSNKMSEGSVISSTPIAVLFLSPPESVFLLTDPTGVSAECSKPKSESNYSTLASCSSSETP